MCVSAGFLFFFWEGGGGGGGGGARVTKDPVLKVGSSTFSGGDSGYLERC